MKPNPEVEDAMPSTAVDEMHREEFCTKHGLNYPTCTNRYTHHGKHDFRIHQKNAEEALLQEIPIIIHNSQVFIKYRTKKGPHRHLLWYRCRRCTVTVYKAHSRRSPSFRFTLTWPVACRLNLPLALGPPKMQLDQNPPTPETTDRVTKAQT